MSDSTDLDDLIAHLTRTTRLERVEIVRLLDEIFAFLAETPEAFVQRRHRVLQAEGLSNKEIFERLAEEVERHRFRAPRYSLRQLRRMIYG